MNEIYKIFESAMRKGEKSMKRHQNLELLVSRLMESTQQTWPDRELVTVNFHYLEKVAYAYLKRLKTEKELIVDTVNAIVERELSLLNSRASGVEDTWPDNYGWYLKSRVPEKVLCHLPEKSSTIIDLVPFGLGCLYRIDDDSIAIEKEHYKLFNDLISDPCGDIEIHASHIVDSLLGEVEEWKSKHVDKNVITWKIGENHDVN